MSKQIQYKSLDSSEDESVHKYMIEDERGGDKLFPNLTSKVNFTGENNTIDYFNCGSQVAIQIW